MWRASELTIGIATVAMIVPATSGPTMVDVVPSSQVKPASSAKTPTSNHDVLPRSFSQRGAANVDSSSPASSEPNSNDCDSAAGRFLPRCLRKLTVRCFVP